MVEGPKTGETWVILGITNVRLRIQLIQIWKALRGTCKGRSFWLLYKYLSGQALWWQKFAPLPAPGCRKQLRRCRPQKRGPLVSPKTDCADMEDRHIFDSRPRIRAPSLSRCNMAFCGSDDSIDRLKLHSTDYEALNVPTRLVAEWWPRDRALLFPAALRIRTGCVTAAQARQPPRRRRYSHLSQTWRHFAAARILLLGP